MKPVLTLMALLALAACGADGEPVKPTADASVTLGPGGVSSRASVGITRGPVSVRVGL
ncbi:hypothetical protein [Pseudaestuariivita atlantica]|uniref:hypothetical protein n=1 Tax=Pseudaestuariivita atlantica TaxID=1317121 RepID=UPI000A647B99|nr:hypothetical protein [Pseudaestuariivita atlantica]